MGRKKKKVFKPWCWYCSREFEDEKILIYHQKSKHFRCPVCKKKLASGPTLAIHCMEVHKEPILFIPNALPHRSDVEMDIFGTEGIPAQDVEDHKSYLEAQNRERKLKGKIYKLNNKANLPINLSNVSPPPIHLSQLNPNNEPPRPNDNISNILQPPPPPPPPPMINEEEEVFEERFPPPEIKEVDMLNNYQNKDVRDIEISETKQFADIEQRGKELKYSLFLSGQLQQTHAPKGFNIVEETKKRSEKYLICGIGRRPVKPKLEQLDEYGHFNGLISVKTFKPFNQNITDNLKIVHPPYEISLEEYRITKLVYSWCDTAEYFSNSTNKGLIQQSSIACSLWM